MRGASEFSLKLNSENFGVLLRRKLDYTFPNQRAEVFVADESNGAVGEFKSAGIWYLAGGNTCVYSNPKEELGATQHVVQTSNRRFRDDEFIVPRDLTRDRASIRVRVKFTPIEIPLFPGQPLTDLAWSEISYAAYCKFLHSFRSLLAPQRLKAGGRNFAGRTPPAFPIPPSRPPFSRPARTSSGKSPRHPACHRPVCGAIEFL